jgi:hypothetical protein
MDLLIERNELAVFHSGREADENDCCRACRSHHDGHYLDVVLDDPEMPEQRLGHRVREQAFEEWAREGERLDRARHAK